MNTCSSSSDRSFSKVVALFKKDHKKKHPTYIHNNHHNNNTKMNIMNIQGPNTTGQRSTLDYSIVGCFTLILLLFILLLDAYEYVTVPGASHARNQLHQGLEDLTGMEIMTKQELAQLTLEVEQAKLVVHDKKEEVEEIVEK
eukprot:scaffold41051_cov178-Skeletonema_dohrnii-CCMP3373.AAC.1